MQKLPKNQPHPRTGDCKYCGKVFAIRLDGKPACYTCRARLY